MLACHGCQHCWYSAPGGQVGDWPGRPAILSQPHSRCTALDVYVPMIVGDREKWLGSEIPKECPQHAQPALF